MSETAAVRHVEMGCRGNDRCTAGLRATSVTRIRRWEACLGPPLLEALCRVRSATPPAAALGRYLAPMLGRRVPRLLVAASARCVHSSRAASVAQQAPPRPTTRLAQRVRTRLREREPEPSRAPTSAAAAPEVAHVGALVQETGPGTAARELPWAPADGLDAWDDLYVHVPYHVRDVLDPEALRPSEMRKLRESAVLVYEDLMGTDSGERDEELSEAQELLLLDPDPAEWWRRKPVHRRTTADYNRLLRVQGAHGRLDLALRTFHELASMGGEHKLAPDLATLTAMFSACAVHGAGGLPFANEIFSQLEADMATAQAQLEAEALASDSMMVSITQGNPILQAQLLAAYSSYMKVLVESGDPAGAEHVVGLARQRGLSPDIVMMTNLMQAHIKVGDTRSAWREWTLMPRRGVEPDAVTYTAIINMCAAKGELERAFSLWDQLHQTGIEPTPHLYNTMIRACAQRRDFYPDAIRLLDEMEASGFVPTTRAYEALLVVASRRRDIIGAEKIWSVLTSDGNDMPTGLAPYTTMISAYTSAIRRHLKDGGKAGPLTHNASLVWNQMIQNAGVPPDAHALNGYLALWAASHRLKRLNIVLSWYEEFGVARDAVTYNILSVLWSDMRRPVPCLALRDEMAGNGVAPDAVCYRAWLTVAIRCALRGREIEASGSIKPKSKHVRERARYMGTALDLLGEMHTKGVLKPPIVPWRFTPPKRQTERIGAYGKRKKRERQPNAPRFTIGEVPGDAKQGAGSIGGSTQAWFKLRKLCYQDERLREAFDNPRTLRQSAGAFLPRSALRALHSAPICSVSLFSTVSPPLCQMVDC